jgi:hypothetical protein
MDSYPASAFAGFGGNLIVPVEFPNNPGIPPTVSPTTTFNVEMVAAGTGAITHFDTSTLNGWNREGSTFTQCVAIMPIIKHSTDANRPPTNADFIFGLYPRGDSSFPAPPAGPLGYTPNTDGPAVCPAGSFQASGVRGTCTLTPPENTLPIQLSSGPFFGSVCELKHTAGWTFSSIAVSFTGAPTSGSNSASPTPAGFLPTGETTDTQIRCINLVIQPGTTEVDIDVTDKPPLINTSIATTLLNNPPLAAPGSETDSVTITHSAGPTITGTVTYSFFTNGTCAAPADSTQTVTIAGGVVPNSSTHSNLAAGNYSFNASYSGDSNYAASGPSACEPFNVVASGTGFCSPGLWKTHPITYTSHSSLTENTLLSTLGINFHNRVVGNPDALAGHLISSLTIAQGLGLNGGGYNALTRATLNAYLSAVVFGSHSKYSVSQVQTMAGAAYAGSGTNPFTATENCLVDANGVLSF